MGAAGGPGPGPGHRPAARRWGRVTGLGPHERGLLRGLQPREEGTGFKGPQQTNPCYPAGAPRQAASRACLPGGLPGPGEDTCPTEPRSGDPRPGRAAPAPTAPP